LTGKKIFGDFHIVAPHKNYSHAHIDGDFFMSAAVAGMPVFFPSCHPERK